MKRTILLFAALIFSIVIYAQEKKEVKINNKDGKYELTIEKEVNGKKSVETRTYDSREEMMNDPALEGMNIFVMDGGKHTMKIESKGGEKVYDFKFDSKEGEGDEMTFDVLVKSAEEGDADHIVIKKSNVMVFSGDDDAGSLGMNGFEFKKDENGDTQIWKDGKQIEGDVWVDEDGNEFKIKKSEGRVMITNDDGDFDWTGKEDMHFNISIDGEHDGDHKVIIFKSGDGEDMEWVEKDGKTIEIKKIHEGDGDHKVMIFKSEDGEVVELTGEHAESIHLKKIMEQHGEGGDGNVFIIKSDGEEGDDEIHKDVQVFVKKMEGGSENVKITVKVIEKLSLHIEEVESGDFESLMDAKAKKLKLDDINYYPNPSAGKFNLEFVGQGKPTSIKVLSLGGKEIYSEELSGFEGSYNNEIDLSSQKKGIYLLRIQQGSRTINKKIVID